MGEALSAGAVGAMSVENPPPRDSFGPRLSGIIESSGIGPAAQQGRYRTGLPADHLAASSSGGARMPSDQLERLREAAHAATHGDITPSAIDGLMLGDAFGLHPWQEHMS